MSIDSYQYLPFAEATAIRLFAPLLGIWLSYWNLSVFWDIREVLAGLVSFVGVLMIAQPSLLFSTSKNRAPFISANCTDKIDIFRVLTNNTCLLLGAQPGCPKATSAQRIFVVLVALAGLVGKQPLTVRLFGLASALILSQSATTLQLSAW